MIGDQLLRWYLTSSNWNTLTMQFWDILFASPVSCFPHAPGSLALLPEFSFRRGGEPQWIASESCPNVSPAYLGDGFWYVLCIWICSTWFNLYLGWWISTDSYFSSELTPPTSYKLGFVPFAQGVGLEHDVFFFSGLHSAASSIESSFIIS